MTNILESIPIGLTWFGALSGVVSLIWHFYNSYCKLPVVVIKSFRSAEKYGLHGNGLTIEIINSTNTPVIIKKNFKVTGRTLIEHGKLGSEKSYTLEIEDRDSSHVILPAWESASYPASSNKNIEELPLHLFLVRVSISFYGKLNKIAHCYYLHEPAKDLSVWQYWKKRLQIWLWPKIFFKSPTKLAKKITDILDADFKQKT